MSLYDTTPEEFECYDSRCRVRQTKALVRSLGLVFFGMVCLSLSAFFVLKYVHHLN